MLRLEKDNREMEKSLEALRHSQAKVAELERTNKKLYSQSHDDRKGIIKLKEVCVCVCLSVCFRLHVCLINISCLSAGGGNVESEG